MEQISFEDMVNNAYMLLNTNNNKEFLILPQIKIDIEPTRIHWKNVKEYLVLIKRNPMHFMQFLKLNFLGKSIDWTSESISTGLFIHGKKIKENDIKNIMIKYINEYVICNDCKKSNTSLMKSDLKKYLFKCNECGVSKYI